MSATTTPTAPFTPAQQVLSPVAAQPLAAQLSYVQALYTVTQVQLQQQSAQRLAQIQSAIDSVNTQIAAAATPAS